MTFEEIIALNLSPLALENKMNEVFEITVVDLLYKLGYEEQGFIRLEEGDYDYIWNIVDELNVYNPDLPYERIKTGYIFLPETLQVMRKEDY